MGQTEPPPPVSRGATEPLPCGAESGKRLLVLLPLHLTSAFAVALKPRLVPSARSAFKEGNQASATLVVRKWYVRR